MLYKVKRILVVAVICLLAAGGLRLHTQIQKIDARVSYSNVDVVSLIAQLKQSVVYVKAPDWNGSGVIIGPHTIATTKHVIEYAGDLIVITDANKQYDVISYAESFDNDCGLLYVTEEIGPVAELGDYNKLQLGQRILIIGSPFNKQHFNTVTFGIVSGLERDIPFFGECKLFTVDAASWSGNSGGPVFDMQGRVVGLLIGGMDSGDNFSVCIPIDEFEVLLYD